MNKVFEKIIEKLKEEKSNVPVNRLLVEAEEVNSGKKVVGFVCCCKDCSTKPYGEELKLDRPYGLLTHKDYKYGNVLVYTDTMKFVNKRKILLKILGFILTVVVGFIVIIATMTFIIAWSAIG